MLTHRVIMLTGCMYAGLLQVPLQMRNTPQAGHSIPCQKQRMLRPLIGGLRDELVNILPSLQHKRTVVNPSESQTTGKSAVAIAFGSNLVGNCALFATVRCYTLGSLVRVR